MESKVPVARDKQSERGITMKYAALAATLLVASTSVVSAHDYGYGPTGIDQRRAWEQRRIYDGVRSGQLTWREYGYLQREQARIARDERHAKADGYNFTVRTVPSPPRARSRELGHLSS